MILNDKTIRTVNIYSAGTWFGRRPNPSIYIPLKATGFGLQIGLVLMLLVHVAQAQRIYNKKLDEQAQKLQQQAAEIKSDPVFEAQMKNLTALEDLDVELVMRDANRDTRASINSFEKWDDVFTRVNRAKSRLARSDQRAARSSRTIGEATAALQLQIRAAKAAIKKLRKNSDDTANQGRLAMLFAKVGDIESVLEMAQKLIDESNTLKSAVNLKALDKTRDTLKVLTDLYDKYDVRIKHIADLKDQLGEFYINLQETALQGLLAQEEHLKILGAIETQRTVELEEVKLLVQRYEADIEILKQYYGCFAPRRPVNLRTERITDTLKLALQTPKCFITDSAGTSEKRPRDAVSDIMKILFEATTIISRGPVSTRLADLRRDHEAHRYAIRQRILQAHVYELTLTAGADRLALFHKGGIKPGQLAQLIYNVANIATPIAIIAK